MDIDDIVITIFVVALLIFCFAWCCFKKKDSQTGRPIKSSRLGKRPCRTQPVRRSSDAPYPTNKPLHPMPQMSGPSAPGFAIDKLFSDTQNPPPPPGIHPCLLTDASRPYGPPNGTPYPSTTAPPYPPVRGADDYKYCDPPASGTPYPPVKAPPYPPMSGEDDYNHCDPPPSYHVAVSEKPHQPLPPKEPNGSSEPGLQEKWPLDHNVAARKMSCKKK